MSNPKDVDAYIAAFPKRVQRKLKEVRAAIKQTAPNAEERISYGMPYYSYKGRLAYFAAHETHIGLYLSPPVIEKFKNELGKHKTAKATVRFPLDREFPVSLIKKLIKAGLRNNEEKMKAVSRETD